MFTRQRITNVKKLGDKTNDGLMPVIRHLFDWVQSKFDVNYPN